MSFHPVLAPWLFGLAALLYLGALGILLIRKRSKRRWGMAVIAILIVGACATPGLPGAQVASASRDLDIYFVLDLSPSAGAQDFNGTETRFSGMEADVNAIAAHFAGASYSLITFGASARVVLPLSQDAGSLKTATKYLRPESPLSSVGSSISIARDVLAQRLTAAQKLRSTRPRLVFYLGDGEQTAAEKPGSFKQALEIVNGGAVLGYGTSQGGKMRTYEYGLDNPGEFIVDPNSPERAPAISRIDETNLRAIAQQLDVPYLHRTAPAEIEGVLKDVDREASSQAAQIQEGINGTGRHELYWIPAVAALAVLIRELGLNLAQMRQVKVLRGRK